jgi:hypothetical protein
MSKSTKKKEPNNENGQVWQYGRKKKRWEYVKKIIFD